ncbi:MAG: mandelate racemase [Betaproteobacteria bacterium SG8_41]|jgi:L-alanine-DL-glutamate epimerase-like enolase superfamily enzyme|nr:MAG: mandelate racemase [Betaproteobacteria bacterium SG8_41]
MRITDIRETAVALKSDLRNAVFDFSEMTTSVVAVITDVVREGRPVAGFAFNSTGRYACGAQMRDRFIPRLRKAPPGSLLNDAGDNLDAEKILACMMQREKPGGHTERSVAIGTIEVAVWDAIAKIAGKPLHRVLAEKYSGGRSPQRVPCYVGGGWYEPGKGVKELQDEIRARLDQGYTTMKIKVGGAAIPEDVKRVEAALAVVGAADRLAVDANAGFDRTRALAYAKALAPFRLRWFEEPTGPLDYALLADVAAEYDSPIGTGENLFSTEDVENLVRFGRLRPDRDIIQTDVPQSYGIVQFSRTLEAVKRHGWERKSFFPHGGNQMTLHIVGGFGLGGCEAYPGVFGIFAGFADDARVENGFLKLPERPGIGFEAQNALYAVMRELVD